jgi:hypothetical protein
VVEILLEGKAEVYFLMWENGWLVGDRYIVHGHGFPEDRLLYGFLLGIVRG